MDVREKLVELLDGVQHYGTICTMSQMDDRYASITQVSNTEVAEKLIAHGVTVQDDMTELIGRGLDNIYWKIYGANKEFNEHMAGYNPSSFCAGFQYAIQLAKGLLTQLPQPPKGE